MLSMPLVLIYISFAPEDVVRTQFPRTQGQLGYQSLASLGAHSLTILKGKYKQQGRLDTGVDMLTTTS